mmetsp:Transcript_33916/g.78473  ORF Transcript_33916/g.78473 Transcript_33916/m.78473 type:complete len:231 (+) Transcript_33916:1077-1769(+)
MCLCHEALFQSARAHNGLVILRVSSHSSKSPFHQRSPRRGHLPVQEFEEDRELDLPLRLRASVEDGDLLGFPEGEAGLPARLSKLVRVQLVIHVVICRIEMLHHINSCPEPTPGDHGPRALHHVLNPRDHLHFVVRDRCGQGVGLPVVEPSAVLGRRPGRRPGQRRPPFHRGVGGFVQIPDLLQHAAELLVRPEATTYGLVVILELLPSHQVRWVGALAAAEADVVLQGV